MAKFWDDVKLIADDENIDVFTISETWLNSNTPKIRLEAYMLVNGCLQPILMIGKIRTSPSRNGRPIV